MMALALAEALYYFETLSQIGLEDFFSRPFPPPSPSHLCCAWPWPIRWE